MYHSAVQRIYGNVFWSGSLKLTTRERIRDQYGWLSEAEIDEVCCLLKEEHPDIGGLRHIDDYDLRGLTCTTRSKRIQVLRRRCRSDPTFQSLTKRQGQIISINGNHWVYATNRHDGPENLVLICDSLPGPLDEDFEHKVAAIFKFDQDHLILQKILWHRLSNLGMCRIRLRHSCQLL